MSGQTEIEVGGTAVATQERNGTPAHTGEVSELVKLAIEEKVSVDVLERLVALQERVTDRAAESAMNDAIRLFQESVPLLRKSRTAEIATKSGAKFSYTYAPLSEIVNTIRPLLAKCGLSYTWNSDASGGAIAVTCTLRHVDGAERSATFSGPTSSNSGASDIQKVGAALTYGRRQSLVQVLGLTSADDDVDGADLDSGEKVTPEQVETLTALVSDVLTDTEEHTAVQRIGMFLAFLGVEAIADLPARRYDQAVRFLEAKRAKQASA